MEEGGAVVGARSRRCAATIVASILSMPALVARAEAPSPAEPEVRRLDESAQYAFDEGDYQLALEQLRAAQALLPADNRLYNIAVCFDLLGQRRDAIEYFGRYLAVRSVSDPSWSRARRRYLELREEARAEAASPPLQGPASERPPGGQPERAGSPPRPRSGLRLAFFVMTSFTASVAVGAVSLGAVALQEVQLFDGTRGSQSASRLDDGAWALTGFAAAGLVVSCVLGYFAFRDDSGAGEEATSLGEMLRRSLVAGSAEALARPAR